jgi:hypothetical protein
MCILSFSTKRSSRSILFLNSMSSVHPAQGPHNFPFICPLVPSSAFTVISHSHSSMETSVTTYNRTGRFRSERAGMPWAMIGHGGSCAVGNLIANIGLVLIWLRIICTCSKTKQRHECCNAKSVYRLATGCNTTRRTRHISALSLLQWLINESAYLFCARSGFTVPTNSLGFSTII